jgi:hypothetical protein
VLTILALGNQPAKPQAKNSFDGFALVDKSGNIRKPKDYRDLYQTLGTYFVLDPKGESDAPNLRIAGSRRILPAQQEIRRRHGSGEGSLRN